ncbi:hypothetical protein C1H76_9206 [Elsinoe australis]|uniref:Uncharacterized protein n=1 Tax=Elsinoe australis TaxID=40998 RepID=A0A4U7ATX6_9PEZI|nr:hypothetical protein C1H76_9206 [Elsinoe australis]
MPRTRAQERAPSAEPGASQQGPTRTNRKRRASTTSQASEMLENSQPDSQPMLKKRKKSKVVIQETAQGQNSSTHPSLSRVEEEESQTKVNSHEPEDDENNAQQSQTSVKTTTSRRVTLPASAFTQEESRPTQKIKPRKSLPSALTPQVLSQSGQESGMISLNQLIQQRVKQRLSQSMMQVDGSDDIVVGDLSQDILVYSGVDGPSQLPDLELENAGVKSPGSDFADDFTEIDSAIVAKSDQERTNYEASIKRLAREASEAKSSLEIFTVELQAMGFGSPDANPQAVIDSIRASFDKVRHRLRDILPLETSADVLEHAVLTRITDHVILLANRNANKEATIIKKSILEQELLAQIDALVEKLTEAEIIRERLQQANGEFDNQNEEDDKYIKELEEKLVEIEKSHFQVSSLLQDKMAQVQGLEAENSSLEDTCEKLKSALQDYRQSETKLHELITRMEQEHAETLGQLEKNHKVEHKRFTEEVRVEREGREAAEARAIDREEKSADLAKSLEKEAAMISKLKAQIEELRSDMLEAQSGKEAAEEDAALKANAIQELEQQLADSEAAFAKSEADLADLRKLNESERRQREAAEAELDESHVKVKSLNDKLHKQGIAANELRQKLFEVQQRDKTSIEKLQTTLNERTEQFEDDLTAESGRREEFEALAEERQKIIDDLEEQIAGLESSMKKALDDKESLLQELEDRCEKLEEERAAVENSLEQKTAELSALQKSTTSQIKTLETALINLTAERDNTASTLEKVQHQAATQQQQMLSTLGDRDATINDLTSDLNTANKAISDLEHDKASLERRVESEAESMLSYATEKDAEVASLKDIVREKQNEIHSLSEKATEVDRAWTAFTKEKDTTIEELEVIAAEREEVIMKLKDANNKLTAAFREHVAIAEGKMSKLRKEVERLNGLAQNEDDSLRQHGKRLLEQIEEVDEDATIISGTNGGLEDEMSPAVRVVEKKKIKRTRKAVRDSGIGGSSDMEGMLS